MAKPPESDLDRRLEAYLSTLRSASPKEAMQRNAVNWHFYAAVTSSAMALAGSLSAATIEALAHPLADPSANILTAAEHFASSKNAPLISAVRLAIAQRAAGGNSLHDARLQIGRALAPPSIAPGGVVPLYGATSIIEPGEWVTIYGTNLAAGTFNWTNNFPTTLGGASVQINGKAAYLMFVSPGQINLQAPDDLSRGPVSVSVTTAGGTATSYVTLNEFAPSFSVTLGPKGKAKFVSGIILRPDHSGAYGGGTYDILGPTAKALGYRTAAAQPGDIVELFGFGFGPTTPAVPAGKEFTGAAPVDTPVTIRIHNVDVKPTFVGLTSTGVYQINLTVPDGLGEGGVPIQALVGGVQTQPQVLFPLHKTSTGPVAGGTGIVGGSTGFGFTSGLGYGATGGVMGGTGGQAGGGGTAGGAAGTGGAGAGTGGGTGGGGGGTGGYVRRRRPPYTPKLHFPPK